MPALLGAPPAAMDVEPAGRRARWRMRAPVLGILVLICGFTASTPTFRDSAPPVPLHDQARTEPMPAGDAPAFLAVIVQPISAPEEWRRIYHEVERCAGR